MFTSSPELSSASKMPCKSWSLEAIKTCPGSKKSDGELVDACKTCYATDGFYNMLSVKNVRVHNKSDWKHDDWVDHMVTLIGNDKYFRWFDSGDCYSLNLAEKIYQVMKLTPNCKHWMPTRQYKFTKFIKIFCKMNSLPNVVVRFSSDSIFGKTINSKYNSVIIPTAVYADDYSVCEAYKRNAKCGECRYCWSKDIQTIAYPIHGKKSKKIIEILKPLTE